MSSSVSTCNTQHLPSRRTAHLPAAPPQHAPACPHSPMRHVHYRHMAQLRSGVSLCLWCRSVLVRDPPAHPQRPPLTHVHELAAWGSWVLFWREFDALSCRGESYVCDLGLGTAVGPFSGLLVHPGRCSVAYPAGRRRKKTKEGARKVTGVGSRLAGGQKKCA